jgi:WD40 repeat protein/tRNA A-37 threonylcarbamoyl transferase component Bud32
MHIVCPHCHNQIEIVPVKPREELTCPACGSTFRLETTDSTTGWSPNDCQKLGRFELLGTLGQGAFGTVYKARDLELDRLVAVKLPRAGNLAGPAELDRFLREARSVAQLRHPSIVAVHEVGQSDGLPYLVSDFVEGVTLTDLLSARRPTARESAELTAAVAEALDYAHQQGIIHRDIKPSNIMIGPDGRPHVMDFGLAKRDAGEITMTMEGQVLGTPAYMSPEQARGEARRVDGRSDVYSLGVVLYRLLTGELPFRGTTRMLLHQVLYDDPRPPRRLNDRLPRDLETICLRALAKEPRSRYQTAGDFAADLRRFMAGNPILARPVGRLERVAKWARRRPAVASLLLLLVAVTVIGFILVAAQWQRAESEWARAENRRAEADEANRDAQRQKGLAFRRASEAQAATASARRQANLARARRKEAEAARREAVRREKAETEARTQEANQRRRADQARQQAEAALLATRRTLASSRVNQAQYALREHNVALANDLLDRCSPDTRGWDWHHLKQVIDGTVVTFPYMRTWAAFSPNGKGVAAVSSKEPATVVVLDLATGKERLRLAGHTKPVTCIAYRPDGQELATSAEDGTVRVWEAQGGKPVRTVQCNQGKVHRLVYSPDGQTLVTAGADATVRLWNAEGAPRATLRGHSQAAVSVAFSPDGRWLASGCPEERLVSTPGIRRVKPTRPGEIKIWDVARASLVHTLPRMGSDALDLAFRPDGLTLWYTARSSPQDKHRFWAWDLMAGKAIPAVQGPDSDHGIVHFAFSPDGRRLALVAHSGSGPILIRILEGATGKGLEAYHGLAYIAAPPIFSPDGRFVAVFGPTGLQLRDLRGGPGYLALRGQQKRVDHVAFSANGRRLVAAGRDGLVEAWDPITGLEEGTFMAHPEVLSALAISPDGKTVATAAEWNFGRNGALKIWELATGKLLHELKGFTEGINALAITRDGKTLVSGGGKTRQGEIILWDLATGRRRKSWTGIKGRVMGIRLSPDGVRMATRSFGHGDDVVIWHIETGRQLAALTGHGVVEGIDYSPDGRYLAVGHGSLINRRGEIHVWDLVTLRPIRIMRGHNQVITTVRFTLDGRSLVSAAWDKTVKVWDLANSLEVITLTGEAGGVPIGMEFSPQGQFLACTGENGVVKVYSGMPCREEAVVRPGGRWTVVRADGRLVANREEDGTVRAWDGPTRRPTFTLRPGGANPGNAVIHLDTGRLALIRDKKVQIFNLITGKQIAALAERSGPIAIVQFSADGQRLATVRGIYNSKRSLSDVEITIWETTTGKPLLARTGPLDWAREFVLGSDLKRLSFATTDGKKRTWDLTRNQEQQGLPPVEPSLVGLAYDPQGRVQVGENLGAAFDTWRVIDVRVRHYDRLVRAGLTRFDQAWHRNEAEAAAEGGDWFAASHHCRLLAARGTGPETELAETRFALAYLFRVRGDLPGFRAACADLLKRFGDTKHPGVADGVAWVCFMMRDAVPDPLKPLRLAERAVAVARQNPSLLNTLGLALYRTGKIDEARRHLKEMVKYFGKDITPEACFVVALVETQLKRPEKGREWLRKGTALIDGAARPGPSSRRPRPPATWHERLQRQWLREEADAALKIAQP